MSLEPVGLFWRYRVNERFLLTLKHMHHYTLQRRALRSRVVNRAVPCPVWRVAPVKTDIAIVGT